MNPPELIDYKKWKTTTKDPNYSLYDYIYQINKSNQINSDIYFAFYKLFWPQFTQYNNYIFLKENFSEEKANNLINNQKNVEYWINIFLVESFFEDNDDCFQRAESFTNGLTECWKIKLEKDFPTRNFHVELISDPEAGDIGLTFYQVK